MAELKELVAQEARPLPVILLLDVSGSMAGRKIQSLNLAVKEMLKTFSVSESIRAEIHVGIITFGDKAAIHTKLQPASKINPEEFIADGLTPMGEAFSICKSIVEDRDQIPSRAYRPSIILVTDGQPNDDGWEQKMHSFIHDGRSAKCFRWALGIGDDCDETMLRLYLNSSDAKVFHAEDATEIVNFFRYVTMSTVKQSKSAEPNKPVVQKSIPNLKDPFDPNAIRF